MILTPLQKLPKNGEDWGKLIVAKGFKRLPKVQNIAQSGRTAVKRRDSKRERERESRDVASDKVSFYNSYHCPVRCVSLKMSFFFFSSKLRERERDNLKKGNF